MLQIPIKHSGTVIVISIFALSKMCPITFYQNSIFKITDHDYGIRIL